MSCKMKEYKDKDPELIWTYQGQDITDIQQLRDVLNKKAIYGIVYKITYEDGKFIIGRKKVEGVVLYIPKGGNVKREGHMKFVSRKTAKKFRRYHRELCHEEFAWKGFDGRFLHTAKPIKKEILQVAYSFKNIIYLGLKEMFKHDVLEDKDCLNDCIDKLYTRKEIEKMPKIVKARLLGY